jgi:hypothetical protein
VVVGDEIKGPEEDEEDTEMPWDVEDEDDWRAVEDEDERPRPVDVDAVREPVEERGPDDPPPPVDDDDDEDMGVVGSANLARSVGLMVVGGSAQGRVRSLVK